MLRRKTKFPRPCDPWDVHAESDVTCIQYWMMFRYARDDDHFLEVLGMPNFKDILGGASQISKDVAVDDDEFRERFPTLYALMAVLRDDDGKPRRGCSLTIVAEDGVVKLGLNERNHKLSLWTSSETLLGAFTAIEEACNERPPRWRKSEWEGKGRR